MLISVQFAAMLGLVLPTGEIAGTEQNTMDIVFADLDGDGQAELVRAVEGGTNQVLALSEDAVSGSDVFLFETDGSDSEDLAIADLDGDGDLDIAVANEDTRIQQLYLNDGANGLSPVFGRLGFTGRANTVIAADLDADGDADLVFGDDGPLAFAMNDGRARFTIVRETHPNNSWAVQDVEAGDVDGDGDLDLIVASEGPNRLLINDGAANFTALEGALEGAVDSEETREADFADIDGDGDLDLYFANVGFRTQNPDGAVDRLLLNDGTGRFTDVSTAWLPDWSAHSLDVDFVDTDRDGDLDILIAASFGGGAFHLENTGGQFAAPVRLGGITFNALDMEVTPAGDQVVVAGFDGPDRVFDLPRG